MRIFKTITSTWSDFPDNESCAVLVYFAGCSHNCPSCQNKDSQNHNHPDTIDISATELYQRLLLECKKQRTNKLVFSGGDPLYPFNILGVKEFLTNYSTQFNVCIYTGYTIEYIQKNNINCKFIKSGVFEEQLQVQVEKTDTYTQLASTNQIIYDGFSYTPISANGKLIFKNQIPKEVQHNYA